MIVRGQELTPRLSEAADSFGGLVIAREMIAKYAFHYVNHSNRANSNPDTITIQKVNRRTNVPYKSKETWHKGFFRETCNLRPDQLPSFRRPHTRQINPIGGQE